MKAFGFIAAVGLYLFCIAYSPRDQALYVALFLIVPLALIGFPAQINRATVNVTNPKREPSSWHGGDGLKDVPTPAWLLSLIGWIMLAGYAGYLFFETWTLFSGRSGN